jgi:hypothetical protein
MNSNVIDCVGDQNSIIYSTNTSYTEPHHFDATVAIVDQTFEIQILKIFLHVILNDTNYSKQELIGIIGCLFNI